MSNIAQYVPSSSNSVNKNQVLLAIKKLKTAKTLNTVAWCCLPLYGLGQYVFPFVGLYRQAATNIILELDWPKQYALSK